MYRIKYFPNLLPQRLKMYIKLGMEKMKSKEEILKKNTQDLNKQLYIAYKKIKDLTDRLNGIKVQKSNEEKEKYYD